MSDFGRVPQEVVAARHDLARRVRDQLAEAGIPAFLSSDGFKYSGADIEVDPVNDEVGVYVTWQVSEDLARKVTQSVVNDQSDDPSIQRSAVVTWVMRDALMTILEAMGFRVEESTDEMRPAALQVLSAP